MEQRKRDSDSGRRVRARFRSEARLLGAIALSTLAACGGGVETVENPIGNRPPIVNAGPDQDVVESADVTLDGSGSTDPDGDALTYEWIQLAGPAVTLDSTSTSMTGFVAPDVPAGVTQTLDFQLTVSDGELSRSATVSVRVGENGAPNVDAGENQTVFEAVAVSLTGVATDPNGDALTYQWTQVSGPAVTLDSPTSPGTGFVAPDVAAGAPQTLIFQLTVSDGQFAQADTVSVRVEENVPPVANAGPDQTVSQNTLVSLDGSLSNDPNSIGAITYSWVQIAGPAVTLTGSATAMPTFTAPAVAAGSSELLQFELTVSDGTFDDSDTVAVTVEEQATTTVGVSGRVNYEFVPPNSSCQGLDFPGTIVRPIRGATVQLLDVSTGAVIDSTVADDTGAYAFTGVDPNIDVRLRVRAELKRTGSPAWDVDVRDNTSNTTAALPSRPLYVMDGPGFNSGTANSTQNLTATTGWGGTAYTSDRTAAPFAILDAIYSGMQLVTSVDPGAAFGPLDAFWSVNNTLVDGDLDAGEIGTSYYTNNPDGGAPNPSLFLLGDADNDTEEFDDHIVVHEWGHYFEDTFSRSDSIGGRHALGESLDPRLAFGEGFATALAAMALAEPLYCDTGVPGTSAGFGINAESANFGLPGWYNEVSVVTLIYDLWDTATDGTDTGSIGFAPIYDTMAGPQATTPAFTSIFSFAAELRTMLDGAGQALLDSQLVRENIEPGIITIWADGETNNANHPDVLPVYTDMTGDGSVVNVCTTSEFEPHNMSGMLLERNGNKLSEQRFLRLTVPTNGNYAVLVETTTPTPVTADPNGRDQRDPDIFIQLNGTIVASGLSGDPRVESFTTTTPLQSSAVYAVELEEFRYNDGLAPDNYPEQVCFDVSFTLAP